MQSVGLCLCDRPFISVRTKDATYYCNAVMIGTTSRELYTICQNQTVVLKNDEIREIKIVEWRNPISEIIADDIETNDIKEKAIERLAPSNIEIREEST